VSGKAGRGLRSFAEGGEFGEGVARLRRRAFKPRAGLKKNASLRPSGFVEFAFRPIHGRLARE